MFIYCIMRCKQCDTLGLQMYLFLLLLFFGSSDMLLNGLDFDIAKIYFLFSLSRKTNRDLIYHINYTSNHKES